MSYRFSAKRIPYYSGLLIPFVPIPCWKSGTIVLCRIRVHLIQLDISLVRQPSSFRSASVQYLYYGTPWAFIPLHYAEIIEIWIASRLLKFVSCSTHCTIRKLMLVEFPRMNSIFLLIYFTPNRGKNLTGGEEPIDPMSFYGHSSVVSYTLCRNSCISGTPMQSIIIREIWIFIHSQTCLSHEH